MPAPKRWAGGRSSLEPRDGWAQHAVAHVMEMQCRQRDGIAWMRHNTERLGRRQLPPGAQLVASRAVPLRTRRDRRGAGAVRRADLRQAFDAGAEHARRLGAAVAAASQRRRCRRPLGGTCRQLGAQGQGRQLRLQRRACDDGLRRRRAGRAGAPAARGAASRRWPAAATMPASPAMSAIRSTLAIKAFGDGDYAEAVDLLRPDPQHRLPLRRQPCAARRDRPDADRGGVPRRRDARWRRHCRPNARRRGRTARCRSFSCAARPNSPRKTPSKHISRHNFCGTRKKSLAKRAIFAL